MDKNIEKNLLHWAQFNFSNRIFAKICHFGESTKDSRYEKHIEKNYNKIIAELKNNPYKASPVLATLATSECFSATDFLTISKMSKDASASELKEFCELREQHPGSELRMIDYLCFPMIVKMTKYLPITDKINLIMTKPELLSDKIYMHQSLKELMPGERSTIMDQATPEQKEHLENELKKEDTTSEIVHYNTSDIPNGYIWLVCIEAQNRYKDIKAGREQAAQKISHKNINLTNNSNQLQRS